MSSDKDLRLFLLLFKQRRFGLRENMPQVACSDERKQTQNVDQDFISCMCVITNKQTGKAFIYLGFLLAGKGSVINNLHKVKN